MIKTHLRGALGAATLKFRASGLALLVAALVCATSAGVNAQERFDDPTMPRTLSPDSATPPTNVTGGEITTGGDTLGPDEGEIYNLTDKPFTFRLLRKYGKTWTPYYTLKPGMRYVTTATQRSDLLGITGDGKGSVTIQFPDLGGMMSVRLPARAPSTGKLEPTWFCIKDATGITRLVQAENPEAAQAIQQQLQKEQPLTPAQVEQLKFTLRANWVYADRGNNNGATGRSPYRRW